MNGRFWSRLSVGISNVRLTFRGWKQAAKHSSLPTTRLVLASRCGFTKSALQKAEALGLETMEYADGVPAQVGERIIGHGGELWIKGVVAIDCAMDLKIANRFGDRSMPVPNGAHSSIEGHPCDGGI